MLRIAPKPVLTDQVYEQIKSAIISGELAPSAGLAQESLAAEMGVSRQPVSHALVLLEKDGLVVEKGRKGRMVAPIDKHKLRDLYQVRSVLDGLAARLCALRLEHSQKAELQKLLKQGYDAAAKKQTDQLVTADIAFHTAIYLSSGNPEIFAATQPGWPHMMRAMHIVLNTHHNPEQIWHEHEAIVKAITDNQPETAWSEAAGHAEKTGQMTFENLADEHIKTA